jgi:hypothetical protein
MNFTLKGKIMNNRALAIYKSVLEAMQDADEIEGVEGDDYLKLMTAIAEECMRRFDNCTDQWASDQEANTNSH